MASPATFWHVTLDEKHKLKPHVLQFVFCITLHNRNGAVIACWCLHSIQTTVCFQTSNLLWVWTQISLTSSLFGHVVLGQACHFFPPTYLTQRFPLVFSFLFVLGAYFSNATYTEKNRSRKRTLPFPPPPSSFSVKGESRKGGRRSEAEGEGNTIQTELCLTSLPPERRKDWYKVRLNRIERQGRGRAEGINAKKEKGWQWCSRAASVLVHREQKALCSWMGAGELSHMASAVRKQAG